jgi:hypothetical protein
MNDLRRLLPGKFKKLALDVDDELVFPFPQVLEVIQFATSKDIAVLGVEVVEAQGRKLKFEGWSVYDTAVHFEGDWLHYVRSNNASARDVVERNPCGEEHGYVLTAVSKDEFDLLPRTTG